MKQYEVIEDNGGGLHLAVFGENGECEYLHASYEYCVGQLKSDISALKDNADVSEWEGNEEDPQSTYDQLTSYECGWDVIADNDGLYFDRMGASGHMEFGD